MNQELLGNKQSEHQTPAWPKQPQKQNVYFDCNATTPTHPLATAAAVKAMQGVFGNPSSSHAVGLEAKHILEHARSLAAMVVGCAPTDKIVFTSGATEAIHIAVFSAFDQISRLLRLQAKTSPDQAKTKRLALYGATEHKAVPQAILHWNDVLDLNLEVLPIPVDKNGQINLVELQALLPNCVFIATMAVNNETAIIAPLREIEGLLLKCQSRATWLVDCVQALGKIPLNLKDSRIDFATFSGHKLYAPKGIGFLYAKSNAPLRPFTVGGGQEQGIRCGTENIPGVAALGVILAELLRTNVQQQSSAELEHKISPMLGFLNETELRKFRKRLATCLLQAFPGLVFNAPFDLSLGTTINFSVPGLSSREIISVFDAAGVQVSAGSACSAGKATRSYVLDAMGLEEWRSSSAIRLSLGPATTEEQIQKGMEGILRAANALRSSCMLPGTLSCKNTPHMLHGVLQFSGAEGEAWIVTDRQAQTAVIIDPTHSCLDKVTSYLTCRGYTVVAALNTNAASQIGDYWQKKAWQNCEFQTLTLSAESLLIKVPATNQAQKKHLEQALPPRCAFVLINQQNPTHCFFGNPGNGLSNTLHQLPQQIPMHNLPSEEALLAKELINLLPENCLFCFSGCSVPAGFARTKDIQTFFAPPETNAIAATHKQTVVACQPEEPKTQTMNLATLVEHCQNILLQTRSAHGEPVLLLDVRETWEWLASQIWEESSQHVTLQNVPLSALPQFASELLHKNQTKNRPIICVCASGYRSLVAAQALRRIGFENVFSLQGGVACNLRAVSLTTELHLEVTPTPLTHATTPNNQGIAILLGDKDSLDYVI